MVQEGGIWKMGFYQVYLVSDVFPVLCWRRIVVAAGANGCRTLLLCRMQSEFCSAGFEKY